ncbi:uncharacterized protein LOC144653706 isoform X1 [Oculina patagonica]
MHTSAIDVKKSLQSFHGNGKEQIRVEITIDYGECSLYSTLTAFRSEFYLRAFTKPSVNRKECTHTRKISNNNLRYVGLPFQKDERKKTRKKAKKERKRSRAGVTEAK